MTTSRIAKNRTKLNVSRKRRPRSAWTGSRGNPKTRVNFATLYRLPLHCPFGALRHIEHVSDAAHCLDHFLRPLIVDLAAEVADVDVDDIGEPVVIHVPDMLDDHGAAERA